MTLNINSSLSQSGTAGTNGTNGALGTSALRDGGNGGNGTAGQSVFLDWSNQALTGDAGADRITVSRVVTAGNGGNGGTGGNGAPGEATSTSSSGPGFTRADTVWDAPGNGGLGGAAGAGGTALVQFLTLSIDVAGGTPTPNTISLTGIATGARGGVGGTSGAGGNSGTNASSTSTTTSSGTAFSTITTTSGTPGGFAPDGRDGLVGRTGTVEFSDIAVFGENLRLTINGTGQGGAGSRGGAGAAGGDGSVGANGGDGGNGGNGGTGTATLTGLDVDASGGLALLVNLWGRGGNGGSGNAGGSAGYGRVATSESLNGAGAFVSTTTYADAGDGGTGGNGGRGIASMTASGIGGSDAVDTVEIALRATGGNGLNGGPGGSGANSSSTTTGTTFTQTFTVIGTDPGLTGADGIGGRATVTFTDNTIGLGGGNDVLTLRLTADGPGPRSVTMARNNFDGGTGADRIVIGALLPTDRNVTFDVANNRVKIGADWNGMTGFETFWGGSGKDRFLDGAGNQTYQGFAEADRFEFLAGLAGNDRIDAFQADDVIRLRGFGPALDSFAEVLAAATNTGSGALIQTSATSSILVAGVLVSAFVADDFAF